MKIQCSCGAKYSFDVTPASAANPVRFVCPACGVDSSAIVNELIQRELGVESPQVALPPPAPPDPAPSVAIVIPTRDRLDLLAACVESVELRTTYPNYTIVLLDNDSKEPETLAWLDASV